jgi:CubicO group peptidase (beta-lactamase class C family)
MCASSLFLALTIGGPPAPRAQAQAQAPSAAPAPTPAVSEAALRAVIEERWRGDRTGACVAAALIDQTVSRAFVCADPARARPLDSQTTFEIGSVTKTMTAFLLADLIDQGKLSLEDTLAQHLPKATKVPTFGDSPIRLKHLVTHTSGLPPLPGRMAVPDPDNPYAKLSEDVLLGSLGDVVLKDAPGSRWAYSNFAVMLLSYVVSHTAGRDIESLLADRLFGPLGMAQAHVAKKPRGVRAAQGHLPTGLETSAWDIPANLAGVGGVRASLDDMIRYARAELGRVDGGPTKKTVARVSALMAKTQQPVALGGGSKPVGPRMGMGWVLAPVGDGVVAIHEGGTGGFSSYIAVEKGDGPSGGRAVVILCDTAVHSIGGLSDLGLHLLHPTHPMSKPRKPAVPSAALLDSLTGDYRLANGLAMKVTTQGGLCSFRPRVKAQLKCPSTARAISIRAPSTQR